MTTESIGFGVSERNPTGLAWHREKLYMVGKDNGALYTLNPDNGLATPPVTMAELGINGTLPGKYPEGLASDGRDLYLLCSQSGDVSFPITGTGEFTGHDTWNTILYQIDPEKNAVLREVPVSLDGSRTRCARLVFDGEGFYTLLWTEFQWEICCLNTSNGNATIVGPGRVPLNFSVAVHKGFFYGVGQENDAYLCVIDPEGKITLQ